jgi:hypothetical protein
MTEPDANASLFPSQDVEFRTPLQFCKRLRRYENLCLRAAALAEGK